MRSVEWAIMRSPAQTYRELTATSPNTALLSTFGRPLVAALVLGAAMTTATSDALDAAFGRTSLAWSFAVVIQWVGAFALVSTARSRDVSRARAVDLLFAASGPWTLWLAGYTLWIEITTPLGRPLHTVGLSLVVPGVWTACLVYQYCRVVLGATPAEATRRTLAHQLTLWFLGAAAFFWAVQGWPRILGFGSSWFS